MYDSTRAFIRVMDENDVHYKYVNPEPDETEPDKTKPYKSRRDILSVTYNASNINGIEVTLFFSEDCHNVAIRCFDLVKIPASRAEETLYPVVNEQNRLFRYGKFCIDTDDHTIQMEMDAVFRDNDVGEICYELLQRSVSICDNAYPVFMKALWC